MILTSAALAVTGAPVTIHAKVTSPSSKVRDIAVPHFPKRPSCQFVLCDMQLTSGPWVRGRPRGALYRPHPLFPAATSPRRYPTCGTLSFSRIFDAHPQYLQVEGRAGDGLRVSASRARRSVIARQRRVNALMAVRCR